MKSLFYAKMHVILEACVAYVVTRTGNYCNIHRCKLLTSFMIENCNSAFWPIWRHHTSRVNILASTLATYHYGISLIRVLRIILSIEDIFSPNIDLGPDLQSTLRQSYDHLMITPELRPTYDTRLI